MTFNLLKLLMDNAVNIVVLGLLVFGALKFWAWYKKHSAKVYAAKIRKESVEEEKSDVPDFVREGVENE